MVVFSGVTRQTLHTGGELDVPQRPAVSRIRRVMCVLREPRITWFARHVVSVSALHRAERNASRRDNVTIEKQCPPR